jgi:transposase
MSPTTVGSYLRRAGGANLSWPQAEELDDAALERALFVPKGDERPSRPGPDYAWVHSELRRKHVTLALLWQEYKAEQPDGYQYTQFCTGYRRWSGTLAVWMRQEHRGGEKLFVDFSGDGIPWIDRPTGERREAALFVAVLGASNRTYVEATENQQLPAWIQCHVHALEYMQGVPRVIVPDQPRTSITKACCYDPELNPAYRDLARHYSTCVIPARPRKPRDKAKVEVGVLLAQRWIIAALRNQTFFSIGEINHAIRAPLERLNTRPMRKLGRSRNDLYLELDKPNLQPLPSTAFEFADWKVGIRVNLDYHVEFGQNYYSVPYQLVHQEVELRATAATVEIFHRQKRIASHLRLHGKHQYSTLTEHMPRSHQAHAEWTPTRMLRWAAEVGPTTKALLERILQERPHPEQGYRACLGILRLGKAYTNERLERASRRALACRTHSYRSVESILKNKLEDQPLPEVSKAVLPVHENIRGGSYYT